MAISSKFLLSRFTLHDSKPVNINMLYNKNNNLFNLESKVLLELLTVQISNLISIIYDKDNIPRYNS